MAVSDEKTGAEFKGSGVGGETELPPLPPQAASMNAQEINRPDSKRCFIIVSPYALITLGCVRALGNAKCQPTPYTL